MYICRIATEADRPALSVLIAEPMISAIEHTETNIMWVAVQQNKIIGYIHLYLKDYAEIQIHDVFVFESERSKGIASHLLFNSLIYSPDKFLAAENICALSSNDEGRAFFHNHGFEQCNQSWTGQKRNIVHGLLVKLLANDLGDEHADLVTTTLCIHPCILTSPSGNPLLFDKITLIDMVLRGHDIPMYQKKTLPGPNNTQIELNLENVMKLPFARSHLQKRRDLHKSLGLTAEVFQAVLKHELDVDNRFNKIAEKYLKALGIVSQSSALGEYLNHNRSRAQRFFGYFLMLYFSYARAISFFNMLGRPNYLMKIAYAVSTYELNLPVAPKQICIGKDCLQHTFFKTQQLTFERHQMSYMDYPFLIFIALLAVYIDLLSTPKTYHFMRQIIHHLIQLTLVVLMHSTAHILLAKTLEITYPNWMDILSGLSTDVATLFKTVSSLDKDLAFNQEGDISRFVIFSSLVTLSMGVVCWSIVAQRDHPMKILKDAEFTQKKAAVVQELIGDEPKLQYEELDIPNMVPLTTVLLSRS